MVLPFPAEVAGLVGASLGEPWGQSFTSDLPFLDPETGRRPLPGHRIIPAEPAPGMPGTPGTLLAGYGIPFTFDPRPTEPLEGVRLAYREGNALVRRDQCGGGAVELVWRGRVASLCLEALKASVKEPGKWRSTIVHRPVDLRGVLPFCGSAVAPGGHQDGEGPSARFQQPFGLAHLPGRSGDPRGPRPLLLVTDSGSHVLRTVTPDGQVATLCGQPGQPGHRDSRTLLGKVGALLAGPAAGPPLFRSPTHAVFHRWSSSPGPFSPPWEEAVVADSGNHVIRSVRLDGRVATLAGTPGVAGYRDSEFARAAVFNDPQGLAVDAQGRVYVADRGNRVIRVISGGAVTTLAGRAGEAGTADGCGAQARFTDLKGMCLHPRLAALLMLDGHALRWVMLPEGQVRTLLGVVDLPGFRDLEEGEVMRQPCLNDPTGITCTQAGFAIADHGNHAVRIVSHDGRSVRTVAGDPAQGVTRCGLVRDGLPGPLDEAYGTLEGPWTVASCPQGHGRYDPGVFVTSGRCLAEIHHQAEGREALALMGAAPPPEAAVGETCVVIFTVETKAGLTVHYTADFLDPDGDRRGRVQGAAAGGETVAVQGRFDQAGAGKVRVRAVTCQGVSAGAELEVRVR
jgi:hypothetical protein